MKKIGLIVLALVVALGALGAGYAAWSQDLTISGNVSTGTFDVVFQNLSTSETDSLEQGTITADNLAADSHSFDVTVSNGYPGYIGVANFEVKNPGSIPVKVKSISVTDVNDTDYSAVINGIVAGDVITSGATKTGCNVTITIASDATQNNLNQAFTVTIATEQGK